MTTDKLIHPPPKYSGPGAFVPPGAGKVFEDLAFGTKVRRMSASRRMPNNADGTGHLQFIATEYSTVSPFNCDNTRLILQHQSYFGLYSTGPGSKYLGDLPFVVDASAEPRWSRTEPKLLYYLGGNDLWWLNTANGARGPVRAFPEYQRISGKGEADISQDGDHFVLCGDDREVFVYQISTDKKGPAWRVEGFALDSLYMTPDNNVLVSHVDGIDMLNKSMVWLRPVTHAGGHMDVTRDTNGDECLIWTNSNDPQPIADCDNAIVKVRLADGHQTCLLKLDWSQAVHVSCPDGNGWAFVETYQDDDVQPGTQDWKVYTNEILQVKLDGSEVRRLLHHRSRPSGYGSQPKATCSRDGSRLAFTSNMGLPQNLGWPAEYTDAYMLTVPGA